MKINCGICGKEINNDEANYNLECGWCCKEHYTSQDSSKFIAHFEYMANKIHQCAINHGWWDDEKDGICRSDGEIIALMHSELSEALEALRHGNPPDHHCPKFSNLEIELADCVIRIMDYAKQRKLHLAAAIIAKNEFNQTRPYKHGKQF